MASYLSRHRHCTVSNGSGLAKALAKEAPRTPNCFHLDDTGKLQVGITLELNHPLTGGKPALFVGGYYILRDRENGCLYRAHGQVRRADIFVKGIEGKTHLKLLVQPEGDSVSPLLHVNMNLPAGHKPKEKFYVGMDRDNVESVAHDVTAQEALLRFVNMDSAVTVYYADGTVVRVERDGDTLRVVPLSVEEQASMRIEHAQFLLEEAAKYDDNKWVKVADFAYHEIIAVMAIGGNRSKSVFQEAFEYLLELAECGKLRPSVKAHALNVLLHMKKDHALQFGWACDRGLDTSPTVSRDSTAFGTVPPSRGPKQEAARRRSAKSTADQNIRAITQGSSKGGSGSQKNIKQKLG